jgi:SAM-dependent methyltransferase
MATYTHGHHESVLRSHRWRTAANSAGYLLPHLEAGMTLLDVGAGPGTITADLAHLVTNVTALEHSDGALDHTRAGVGTAKNVDFVVGDVHALEFPDSTFDVVHAHQVLQHVADPVTALAEMARVTRPGGIVAVRDSDYAAFTWFPQVPELDEWLALYRRIARMNGGEPDAGRRLMSWARAAGLTDVAPSASTWLFATPEDRAWWGGMWADRIIDSDIARAAVASGEALPTDLSRISRAWRNWAASTDGWFVILHGELICRV